MSVASAGVGERRSPYQGLVPYEEADAEWFFGRDEWSEVVADNLRAYRLTVLYGVSGVGKSSLLRAGVVRRLDDEARENVTALGVPRLLPIVFSSWSRDDPVAALKDALWETASGIAPALSQHPPEGALPDVLEAWPPLVSGPLLLVLDQLEELFAYHEHRADSTLAEIATALRRHDPSVHFVLSIREDALASLDHFEGKVSGLGDHLLRLEHLDREAARETITEPLDRWNREVASPGEEMEIEPLLIETTLEQVAAGKLTLGENGAAAPREHAGIEAPYLQLVLTRLWSEERREGSTTLRTQTLERLGGADRIVRSHLDTALAALSPSDQDLAGRTFRYLVTPSGTKIAHRLPDLAEYTQAPLRQLEDVVDRLAGEVRVLRPAGDGRYEIYHDALAGPIVDWRRRWEEKQKRRRERRRLAIIGGGVAAVAAVAAAIAVLAVLAWQARGDARVGQSRALAGQAVASLDTDALQALRFAVEAAETAKTSQAETALRRTLASVLPRKTLRGHEGTVRSVAFSPDGKLIATAGEDGTAVTWDRVSGRRLVTLAGHEGPVTSVAFSPDGRRVVTGGYDGTARIWRTRDGSPLRVLRGHKDLVLDATFSSTGDRVLTASEDGTTRIWDAGTGKRLRTLAAGHGPIFSSAFSPDGALVVTAHGDGNARLWRADSGKLVNLVGGHTDSIERVVFSPDGRLLVTTGRDGTARVWSVRTGHLEHLLGSYDGSVFAADFSENSRRIVTAGSDGTARIWDAESGRLVRALGCGGTVFSAAFGRDGELVTAGDDGTARLWDIDRGGPSRSMSDAGSISGAMFSPDGSRVLATGGAARIWDAASGALSGTLGGGQVVAVSRDGRLAATAAQGGSVRIWDTATDRLERVVSGQRGLQKASFSPDGSLIVIVRSDGRARVWNIGTGRLLHELGPPGGAAAAVDFSPDGQRVLTAGGDPGTVRLWNTESGGLLHEVVGSRTLRSATFSPGGRLVLAVGDYGTAFVWNTATEHVLHLRGHLGIVWNGAFSPTGTRVVTASDDRNAQLWDTATGRRLRTLSGHQDTVENAAFSPDGKLVVTASHDGTARLWDTGSGSLLRILEGHNGEVHGAAFSADGSLIVTAGDDGARVWTCDICGVGTRELLALARERLVPNS